MPSIHTIRWIENLANSNHELYWFDILGKGKLDTDVKMTQIINWNKRKLPYFKGEHFLRKKTPRLYEKIESFLKITANEKLVQLLEEIKPDLVHSFEMHSCSSPILRTMQENPKIKWLYSCWGSDIYKYQEIPFYLPKIKKNLARINYLHTDCLRDYKLAQKLGFKGVHMEIIPGGGGFKLELFQDYFKSLEERKIILVKGYQHHVGRGLQIVKALEQLPISSIKYQVVVFGAHTEVQNYIEDQKLPFKVFGRHSLTHKEILNLMGNSIMYIGNSISDGMPNTLLEAIVMGAFPIQSNPGNVTAEIILNGTNGLLINNPDSISEIKELIEASVNNPNLLAHAFQYNQHNLKAKLEYKHIQQKIVALYNKIESEL
ncbi:glycosyltransferase [Flavobacterium sediminilitoris]|uniref:Glycosyltransferase n=2 Tax=Flavobacteriaceae TaxID=49546 RepID=A0ABY4HMY5_9FLAO|nr:glycosyltransferase [Flavobacterium sediminilitoris]